MKAFVTLLILAFGVSVCHMKITKLSPSDRKTLEDESLFAVVKSPKELPKPVLDLCADHKGRIAAPGEPFSVGCSITDSSPPSNRLIWAMCSADKKSFVIHYETGGIVHGFHVRFILLTDEKTAQDKGRADVQKPLKDYKAFLSALKENKSDDH